MSQEPGNCGEKPVISAKSSRLLGNLKKNGDQIGLIHYDQVCLKKNETDALERL